MREATLTAVRFPDPLVLQQGGRGTARVHHLTRVDDPLADRIRNGDATLGWEGDHRLQLYVDVHAAEWKLIRLEHDGVHRIASAWTFDAYPSTEIVPAVILWLKEHDSRRGFHVVEHVNAHNDRVHAENNRQGDEQLADAVDRVRHAMRQDGAT